MTRFNITLKEGVNLVAKALDKSLGGEIFIPKLKSFKIVDLATAMNNKNNLKIVGIRPGEKIHEQMITKSDSYSTIELRDMYIILPSNDLAKINYYKKKFKAKNVQLNFEYSSNQNGKYLSVKQLQKIISNEEKHKKITF